MCKTVPLDSLVDVMTGVPMSRAKKNTGSNECVNVKVLTPAAMSDNRIDDCQLVTETVSQIKDGLYTKENDIILKASTPYDCVFIDKTHKGLLVTSFGLILRSRPDSTVDMRYLAAFLGLAQTNKELQSMSKGMTIQLIKKRDLGDLMVPLPALNDQARIAALFESTRQRKELCRAIVEKSDLLLQSEFARTAFVNK